MGLPVDYANKEMKSRMGCVSGGLGEKLKIVGKKTTKEAGPKKTFRPPPSSGIAITVITAAKRRTILVPFACNTAR